MSAYTNITYNYNEPKMNFGQSMLYGMLGSFTGMGGYGMSGYGMFGMMGMGGSLFSGTGCFPGMGSDYYDQMAGYAIGSSVFSILAQGTMETINNNKAKKAESRAAYADAYESVQDLTAEINELGAENTKLRSFISNGTIDKSSRADIISAFSDKGNEFFKASDALAEFNKHCGQYTNLDKTAMDIINKHKTVAELLTPNSQYSQQDIDAAKKEIAEANSACQTRMANAELEMQNAQSALIQAIKDKIAKNEAQIKEDKQKAIEAQQYIQESALGNTKRKCSEDAEIILDAFNNTNNAFDKNKLSQAQQQSGNTNSTPKNDLSNIDKNKKAYQQAFNTLFRQYCHASDNNTREKYKQRAQSLYNYMNGNDGGYGKYITEKMKQNITIMINGINVFGV